MNDELGAPTQSLRTTHTLFVGQVAHGELEIEVEVLRRVWGGDTLVAYATRTSFFTFLHEA